MRFCWYRGGQTVERGIRMSRLRSNVRRFLRHGGDAGSIEWKYEKGEDGRLLSSDNKRWNLLDGILHPGK